MRNVGSLQNMMDVATRCPGYTSMESGLSSSVGAENSKSCKNCQHLSNDVCNKDLYDQVMSSIF